MQSAPQKTPKRRRVTWRRMFLALGVLAALALAGLGQLAGHLETPWLRERVKGAVRDQLHLDIDYRQASLGLHGFALRDLTLASMPEDRDLAPELLHIEQIAVTWQLGDFLPGRTRRAAVHVDGVSLNLVMDTAGVTSLQRVLAVLPPTPEKPPTRLSRLFDALHDAPLFRLDTLHVGGMRARLARRLADGGDQHVYVGDLTLECQVALGKVEPTLDLTLAGAHLQVETTGLAIDPQLKDALRLLPWLAPLASGTGVLPLTFSTRVRLSQDRLALQTKLLAETQELLNLDLVVQPEPEKQTLALLVNNLALLNGVKLGAELRVNDEMTWIDGKIAVTGNVAPIALAGLDAQGGTFSAHVAGLHLALDPAETTLERLDFALETPGLALAHARVAQLRVDGHAQLRTGTALTGEATVQLAALTARDVAGDVTATQAQVTAKLAMLPDGITLTVDGSVAETAIAVGPRTAKLVALTPHLELETAGIAALLADALGALRHLRMQAGVQDIAVTTDGESVTVAGVEFVVSVPAVTQETPTIFRTAGPVMVTVGAKALHAPGGVDLPDGAKFTASARDLRVLTDRPMASTGTGTAEASGPLQLKLQAKKLTDEVTWQLDLSLMAKRLVHLLQPPQAFRKLVNWQPLTMTVHSAGRATELAGMPRIAQDSAIDVRNLQVPGRLRMPRLLVTLRSEGQGLRQQADFALNADIERIGTVRPGGPLRVTGHLDHDPARRHVTLEVNAKGPHGLGAALNVEGHQQGADLAYGIRARAQNLATFLHALPEVDRGTLCLLNPQLAVNLDAHGTLLGGGVVFQQKPPPGIDGHHAIALNVAAVSCKQPQGAGQLGKLNLTADATWSKGAGKAEVLLTLPDGEAASNGHALRLEAMQQQLTVEIRADKTVHVAGEGKLARLTQDAMPSVPLRDLTWLVRGWSGPDGARLELFQLDNPPTGTRLTLTGGLDRAALRPPKVSDADVNGDTPVQAVGSDPAQAAEQVPGRLGLNVQGELWQDLGALAHDNDQVTAHGIITVPVHLESGDLVVFHTEARLHFDHVDVGLTKPGLQVSNVFGDMPLAEAFTLTPQFQLLGGGEDNAYARWRFSEHQPFLRRSDFLSIGKIRYADAELGPIVSNASVDHDVFRMDQLEATLLHGQLTGQCMVLLNGEDTHVELRGNATGLQVAGSDERFDANAALDFLPARRALDGRAEILHMGRKHLESLLNLWDPYGEDTQSNRLRTLLKLGHPQRVKLRFQHGFMDVGVELGGLGGVVQIDELRGIALGPVFQRWLDPFLEPLRALRVREAPRP